MKRLPAVVILLWLIAPYQSYGQINNVFVPFLAGDYTYQFVKSNSKLIQSFYTAGTDPGTGWLTGAGAFGTLNNTGSPPCPLNDAANVQTLWPSSRDLLLRRHVTLPAGTHNLTISVAIDNAVQLFFNGKDIFGGVKTHNDCATEGGDFILSVPDDRLLVGDNVIAVHGIWLSAKNYFDMKVTGDVSHTITVVPGVNGSISPAGPVTIYPDMNPLPKFTITPDAGYRIEDVTVNGVSLGKITSWTCPDATMDYTIAASYSVIKYKLTVSTGSNGTVTINPDQAEYMPGTAVTLTAYAASRYHFAGWTGNLTGLTNPAVITMNSDKSVIPGFESNSSITVSITSFTENAIRDAIDLTNSNPGPDKIEFASGGTIDLSAPLPILTDELTLTVSNGGSVIFQPSSTFPNDGTTNLLQISGVFLPWGYTPQHTTISGITIRKFPGAGIYAQSNGIVIQGCTIMYNGGDGVRIDGGSNNLIGGTEPGQENIIANNGGNGITILKRAGLPISMNSGIIGNQIYDNTKIGIDLGGDGVTQNHYPLGPSVPEARPAAPASVNFGQNFPTLFSASVGAGCVVKGSLLNWRNTQFLIEIFASDAADPSGHGEGKVPVGSMVVTTNDTGYFWFEIPTTTLTFGQSITATATDLTAGTNNTSEFSAAITAGVNTKVFGPGYVVNTTMSGLPLHWPDGKATYSLGPSLSGVSPDPVTSINNSFATWSSLSGTRSDGTPWSLQYAKGGTTTSNQFGGDPDGINNIVWITDDWFTTTGIDANVIAVTRVRYNAMNGEMTDVDIAMNARSGKNPNGFLFGIAPTPDSYYTDESYRDVQNVVTHEAGHFSGLGDLYNPGYAPYVPMMGAGNQDYTMYGIIRGNETIKRSLTQNDKDGIAWIYNKAPQGHIDLMLVFDGSASFVTQYGAFDAAKNSATELVERMNVGDRIGIVQLPGDVKYPLHVITDAASREAVIAVIQGLTQGGSSTIGAGLQAGLTQLSSSVGGVDAMILFSAGEETGVPTALSIVPGLNADNAHVFTLGFAGSTGQDLCSKLADATGGAYFLASSATMSTVVKEIWNRLTTLQTIAYLAFYSNQAGFNWQGGFNYQGGFNWQGGFNYQGGFNWQGGFNYQGAVDEGTLKILPGFNWQGSSGELALVPPQDNFVPPTTWDPTKLYLVPFGVAVITPDNWDQIPVPNQFFTSIRYIEGSTYSFYEVIGPKPGKWTLIPCGDPSNSTQIELLTLSVVGLTDVSMDVSFASATYAPGSAIQAQVSLSQGGVSLSGEYVSGGTAINDATVTAIVTVPGLANPASITLAPQGNGIYKGTLGNSYTLNTGTYDFKFTATGKVTVPGVTGPVQVNFTRLREQSVYVAPPFIADGVLVADGSVTIGDGSAVNSGSVLVNSSSGKLTLGVGVTTPARYTLKANTISIGSGSVVASDVYYNKLTNLGTLGGLKTSTYTFPFLTFPTPIVADAGTADLILSNSELKEIGETKSYRDVILAPQSVLKLKSGGTYNFRSVWVKSNAQMLFTAQTKVTISAGFRPDNGSYVGPENKKSITEADIVFYVAARNNQSAWSTSVNIGPQAKFYGNVEALNGTVWIQENSSVTGAFVSKDVLLGKTVKVALNTSFAGLMKGRGEGWSLAPEQSSSVAEIPTVFSLSQNYPNPFNPTTRIKYTVAGAGEAGAGVSGLGTSKTSLIVYDLLGREVAVLVNEAQQPGVYQVTWDASGQSSGVYFYRLKAGTFVDTKRLVFLK